MAKTGFITVQNSSSTQKGVSQLATQEETISGEENTKIVTPKTLSDKLGDQTQTHFGIGNGKNQPISWAPISSTTLDYSYDPVNKRIILNVKDPKRSDWVNSEYDASAYFARPKDHDAIFGNRNEGPLEIQIEDAENYKNFDTFFVYSMQRGWEITWVNPEKNYQMRFLDKFTTAGTGKIRSTKYGDPTCRDYIKMTYLSHINLWIADWYSSTEFEVT